MMRDPRAHRCAKAIQAHSCVENRPPLRIPLDAVDLAPVGFGDPPLPHATGENEHSLKG